MSEILDQASAAAELAGMPTETFLQAQVHYHTLAVSDPSSPDRMAHLTMMLCAASNLGQFLYPTGHNPEDPNGPMEDPTDPDDPEDDGVLVGAPDEGVNAVAAENQSYLKRLLDAARGR